ncbi:MAG: GGDEF and EAL domain-containing protein [Ruminiclostridium sp.]|nr:GGDEF and EAL domain-containing protein [Ruminiclostridium sp.]
MSDDTKLTVGKDENYIPTGLPGGFFIYNAGKTDEIYFAEENVIKLFGCETMAEFRDFTGNSFKGMVHPEDYDKIQNEIQSQTMTIEKRHDYVRYRIVDKQGNTHYIEDFGHLLHGENGMSFFYVFIVDIDKNEYLNRSRNSFAETQIFSMNQNNDRLTGLYNMATFYQKVQELISDPVKRVQAKFTFVHMDITNFKIFNERYGFQRGDDLLCRVAYTIRNIFGDNSIISRFSNDHFVVCTVAENVGEMVTEVHDAVLQIIEGTRVEIRAGIYELEDTCTEVGLACDHARLACNTVKHRYDVIYSIYDVTLYEKLRKQQYVVDYVDDAIEKEYIKVFYQPVIRVATGEICGYEALARWIDPKFGFLSPADFIETLEKFHLIHKIDSYVVKKVCEDYNILRDHGEPIVPVSINLSRLDFELCDIVDVIENYRRLYNVPREMLDIEITESALNAKNDHLKNEIRKFRTSGFQIWIDDFGSGYSSLNTLMEYDFDVLKLDMEFLRTYDKNPRTGALINYIVYAAVEMGVKPLCEGVETQEHYDFLKDIGCERAQGYFFGKPMPLEETRNFTRAKGLRWETVADR